MKTVFREVVEIDDRWHDVQFRGPILHVAARTLEEVEVWCLNDPAQAPFVRTLRVFGTGHPLPADATMYIGTALVRNSGLVWHLFQRPAGIPVVPS